MPNSIPFSLGLRGLSSDVLALSGKRNENASSEGGVSSAGGGDGSYYAGKDIELDTITIADKWYNADNSKKQTVCPMTLFQSFPITLEENGKTIFTRVTDHTSTVDGAGTDKGTCVVNLNRGICGYPDNATASVLDNQIKGGVKNFKVGAGIGLKYIEWWFDRFFPEIKYRASYKDNDKFSGTYTGGSFFQLIANGCLCAEVVFPISSNKAKVRRIKLVSFGPMHEGPRFDIMPAFCLSAENSEIFNIKGLKGPGGNIDINKDKANFMFKDCHYDYIKGEVIGYGPQTLKDKIIKEDGSSKFDQTKVWRNYTGKTIGGPTGKNGWSVVRVRYFIPPEHKEKAESILKCSIPDELTKTNYDGEIVSLGGGGTSGNYPHDGTIAGMIDAAGQKIADWCGSWRDEKDNKLRYYSSKRTDQYNIQGKGRLLKKGTGPLKFESPISTDCSAGAWWILAEAGFVKEKKAMEWAPASGIWVNADTQLSGSLVEGYKFIKISPQSRQKGDILVWRGNGIGHVAVVRDNTNRWDFGAGKRIQSGCISPDGLKWISGMAPKACFRVVKEGSGTA